MWNTIEGPQKGERNSWRSWIRSMMNKIIKSIAKVGVGVARILETTQKTTPKNSGNKKGL